MKCQDFLMKTSKNNRAQVSATKTWNSHLSEINHIVKDWGDQRAEEDLDKAAIKREVRRLEKKFKRYNVSEPGSMPIEKQEGRCRMMYCQLNNVSMMEVREVKMSAITLLNKKFDIDVDIFAEIGHNWGGRGKGTHF